MKQVCGQDAQTCRNQLTRLTSTWVNWFGNNWHCMCTNVKTSKAPLCTPSKLNLEYLGHLRHLSHQCRQLRHLGYLRHLRQLRHHRAHRAPWGTWDKSNTWYRGCAGDKGNLRYLGHPWHPGALQAPGVFLPFQPPGLHPRVLLSTLGHLWRPGHPGILEVLQEPKTLRHPGALQAPSYTLDTLGVPGVATLGTLGTSGTWETQASVEDVNIFG